MKTGKGKGGDAFFRSVKDSPSSSQFSPLNNFNLFLGSSLQIVQILPDCNSIRPNSYLKNYYSFNDNLVNEIFDSNTEKVK